VTALGPRSAPGIRVAISTTVEPESRSTTSSGLTSAAATRPRRPFPGRSGDPRRGRRWRTGRTVIQARDPGRLLQALCSVVKEAPSVDHAVEYYGLDAGALA
jgi:hypothetical protein